ncbi:MAG: hypothetical protein HRU41_06170 [Saprospiraceae bacterium]|nr:hypothetical protein [Saprospiraceae bacterium]
MISYRNKRILLQLIPFGVIPFVFSIVYSLLEKGILGDYPSYPSTGNPYNFQLLVPATLSMLVGIVLGTMEILYLSKWFQERSFARKIILKSIIYLLSLVVASLIINILISTLELRVSPFDKQVRDIAIAFLSNLAPHTC